MQWERAARGDDGRAYPWGSAFDAGLANTLEGRRGGTSPVGARPRAASPFGVQDMAGNVFEWTRTPTDGGYVVKGGSWSSDAASARAAARHGRSPDLRHVAVGFRCVIEAVNAGKPAPARAPARRK
jgi:formylglycine-generating enzyme required for sulfatase activity